MAYYGRRKWRKRSKSASTVSKVIKPFSSVAGMVTKNTSLKYTLTGMFTIPVVLSVVYPEGWDWITGKVGDMGESINNWIGGGFGGTDSASGLGGMDDATAMGDSDEGFSDWFNA